MEKIKIIQKSQLLTIAIDFIFSLQQASANYSVLMYAGEEGIENLEYLLFLLLTFW